MRPPASSCFTPGEHPSFLPPQPQHSTQSQLLGPAPALVGPQLPAEAQAWARSKPSAVRMPRQRRQSGAASRQNGAASRPTGGVPQGPASSRQRRVAGAAGRGDAEAAGGAGGVDGTGFGAAGDTVGGVAEGVLEMMLELDHSDHTVEAAGALEAAKCDYLDLEDLLSISACQYLEAA